MSKSYVFPESLRQKAAGGTGYPFVSFEFIKRALPEAAAIYLYLPPGFSVPDAASYGSVDLGVIGGIDQTGASNGQFTEGEKKALADEATGKVLGQLGAASVFTKEKIKKGVAINPNTALQFDNVAIRSFNFTFKLVAESSKEAESALLIENMFRRALYPEVKNRLYLEYPPTFKIKFYHDGKENIFMPQIHESFLANMSTTYNASSNMYHADGSPSEIDISLTFTETKALTREDLYPSKESIRNQTNDPSYGVDEIRQRVKDRISSIISPYSN